MRIAPCGEIHCAQGNLSLLTTLFTVVPVADSHTAGPLFLSSYFSQTALLIPLPRKHWDYGHQFLRPVINDYVQTRLGEGASFATVRLELSAIRGLFQFATDMGASDVFFNPAKGVKVRQPKGESPEGDRNESPESPA